VHGKEGRLFVGERSAQSYQHLPMVSDDQHVRARRRSDPRRDRGQTRRGSSVAKLGGGQVNTTTGDFVFGTTEAYLIENGHITEPLRDANLIGNGPEVLRRSDAVATRLRHDAGTCGQRWPERSRSGAANRRCASAG